MATLVRCALGYKPGSSQQAKQQQERLRSSASDGSISSSSSDTILPLYEEDVRDERRPLLGQSLSFDSRRSSDGTETVVSSTSFSSTSGRSQWLSPRVISDAVIGLSDGLTVPFALTAGLSSLGDTKVVITGGIAELVSGAISMGLGGYLGAKSESDCYRSALKKERKLIENARAESEEAVIEALSEYGFAPSTMSAVLGDLEKSPEDFLNFVMRFGRGLEEPAIGREFISAATIGTAYFLGGFVPLFPYLFVNTVQTGLLWSSIIMVVTLFIFGVVKTIFTGNRNPAATIVGGIQMVLTGAVAAGAAFAIVRFIDTA
ncbi:VIT family-domain-containing protein [Lipomyces japonicus]|uniref:VIT family-domain-containing protein n=1 Tax=Lipomyces japonicus TaxID=56871 RepID=UPI0034CDD59D